MSGWTRNLDRPCVVYLVTNSINGKRYIGVTTKAAKRRLSEHLYTAQRSGNGIFYRAIRKYGKSAFSVSVLSECQNVSDGFSEEIRLIAELKPEYNSTRGGDGQLGRVLSDEAKDRISAANKGKKSRLGKSHSAETKKRLSEVGKTHGAKERWEKYSHLGPIACARRVMCLDDGNMFDSATSAAIHYGVAKSALIELCLGKRYRRSVGGRKFSYVEAA